MINIPRVMIAAPGSNSGKTTVTLALLSALKKSGFNVSSFKTGPDYIDPMFHKKVLGIYSGNLDIYLMGEENCKYLLQKNAKDSDVSIIEGVMGYYDGIGNSSNGSSYDLAKNLKTPVILVVNVKGMAISACALINGFKDFRKDSNIKGVILNGVSRGMYNYYRDLIESNSNVKVYGHLPYLENCSIGSRHLGLVTADEILEIENIVETLGDTALETLDIKGIVELSNSAEKIEKIDIKIEKKEEVKIAIAKDKAFCFYYEDSLEILEKMGAELIPFSPIEDEKLPQGIHGIYLGGGYPELYMEQLSRNKHMLKSINDAIDKGIPILAECGGYMYLLESFLDKDKKEYKLVGALKGKNEMTKSLKNFGYAEITAKKDNLLCKKGEKIRIHEFHYSESSVEGDAFIAKKPLSKKEWKAVVAEDNIFAGYPHMHFISNIKFAENYIDNIIKYKKENVDE